MCPIPLNVRDLLRQRAVEGARIEYKAGWNPDAVVRTLCAFANDFENLGGGYVILGQDCDSWGQPVFPPVGLPASLLDKVQQDLQTYCNLMQPPYFPILSVEEVEGRNIIVLWAPGGQNRPYKAPRNVTAKTKDYRYFIRRYSSTVEAGPDEERELISLTASVPFDDRPRQNATVGDLSRRLIEEFLHEVGSDLAGLASIASVEDLGRQMNIVDGPPERVLPKNIGLLFFSDNPERFFPGTQIDVVFFPDGAAGDRFEEKIFRGPIARMVRDALGFIQRAYLHETVIKHADRAEAERFWNFPFAAIEEALVNAVYHRSYKMREPIEVRITPEELTVVSYPGPDRSVQMDDLSMGKAVSRRYRNRRIGEFLKELDLSEGRATGIPKILRKMRDNGSPRPLFDTDPDRTYFRVRLPAHQKVASYVTADFASEARTEMLRLPARSYAFNTATATVELPAPPVPLRENATRGLPVKKTPLAILQHLRTTPTLTAAELACIIGKSASATERAIRKLKDAGLIRRVGSDKKGYWHVLDPGDH